jgi:hypothetical protein
VGLCASANATDIKTGNDELQVRFDNTIRYNFGKRTEAQNPAILNNVNLDDGDRNFAKGSTVTNRLDLLTEFDVVYQNKFGARVSAGSWYDQAYAGSFDNGACTRSNHVVNGKPACGLSDYTQRYYHGASGEILDAFVFGGFDVGTMPFTIRAGRHTVNWGEALLGGGAIHGITYGQAPLDQGKASSTPGIEAKELYRPLSQISAQLQATPELSFAAQYYLQWESSRVMEGGTYYGPADHYFLGGESQLLAAGTVLRTRAADIKPENRGDWGLATRWSPEWLDGTVGLYYRNFTDKLPQAVGVGAVGGNYFLTWGKDIDMLGISLSRQVAGISVGADLNFRKNMPLSTDSLTVTQAQADALRKTPGQLIGPRGNTVHGVLNALGSVGATPLFGSASWAAELTWSRWNSVTSDPLNKFKGRAGNTAIDAVTKDTYGLAMSFTPGWFQVFPGADLSMPVSYSVGLKGNSPVLFGGNKDAGSYSVGLALDLYSKYRFDLKFVDYFGTLIADGTGAIPSAATATAGANGLTPLLKDRGAVYLTFKTAF